MSYFITLHHRHLAQWENELKSERIKEVLEEKVANEGVWIGNVPHPFDLNEETNKLIPNEERKKHTLKMIDLFKRGYSSLRISDYMEELTGRTWHHNKVLRIIRNPALCGDTTWVDKTYEDTHKGIWLRTVSKIIFFRLPYHLQYHGKKNKRATKPSVFYLYA